MARFTKFALNFSWHTCKICFRDVTTLEEHQTIWTFAKVSAWGFTMMVHEKNIWTLLEIQFASTLILNKKTFQKDAYRSLVDRDGCVCIQGWCVCPPGCVQGVCVQEVFVSRRYVSRVCTHPLLHAVATPPPRPRYTSPGPRGMPPGTQIHPRKKRHTPLVNRMNDRQVWKNTILQLRLRAVTIIFYMRDIWPKLEFFQYCIPKDASDIPRFSNRKWAEPRALLEISESIGAPVGWSPST